jgi:hypothetical protein
MRNLLTRMAERAIGVRPVALPLTRPVFATPWPLRAQTLEDDAPPETPSPTASAENRSGPQPSARSSEESSELNKQSWTQRLAQLQRMEQRRVVEHDRSQAAIEGPSLKDVLAHIYGAQNADQHKPLVETESLQPATPGASLLPLSRIHDDPPQHEGDEGERHRAAEAVEPRAARALPQRSVMQEDKVFANSIAGSFGNQARARVEREEAVNDVHISIGRIELKAAQPAVTSMPPRAAASRRVHMSLSEYLERRRGGRL